MISAIFKEIEKISKDQVVSHMEKLSSFFLFLFFLGFFFLAI
jgi:hypothetical protein